MKVYFLTGILICLKFVKFGTCQDLKCNLTWIRTNDANFRNAYRVSIQPTEQMCLDECRGTPGCLAVDIDVRSMSNFFVTCWFHGDPKDLLRKFPFAGVNTYVKKVVCPSGIVPGLPGAEMYWNNNGGGGTGATGMTGSRGLPGLPGLPGFLGDTGATGVTGLSGNTGARGISGGAGAPGTAGDIGATGITGSNGVMGQPGIPGFGMFVKSTCQASWVVLSNTRSPGSTSQLITTRSDCQNLCLQRVDCQAVEYTQASSNCSFHTSVSNLDSKISASGTDQMVISSRCSLSGDTNFTGYFDQNGTTGATGATGANGPAGASGATGMTGASGNTGPPGQAGSTGRQGSTGSTGMIGPPGPKGFPGQGGPTGPAGDTGAPGEVINVDGRCQPTWVLIEDLTSPSSEPYPKGVTLDICMDACLANPLCLGLDFLVTSPPCFLVTNMGNLNDKIRTFGAIQLVLVARCQTIPDLPVNSGGTQASLTSNDQSESSSEKENGKSVESSGAWVSTFFLTLLSVIVTDGICCAAYLAWNKCRSSST